MEMGPPNPGAHGAVAAWGEPWLRDSLPEEAALGRGKAHPRSCFTEPKGGPPQAHWAGAADTCPEGLWGLCSF